MHVENYYVIIYRSENDPQWRQFEDTEYTEKEADAQLRDLKRTSAMFGTSYKFRKRYVYSAVVETLSVRWHK